MIVNPNKIKALVVSRSRIVNPPHGDLVLSVVSICASPNFDILGVKFDNMLTFEYHVRGIVSRVTQRIGILRLVKRVFVDSSVLFRSCYAFVLPALEYCSPVWGLLLNVIFSFSRARCIRWAGFALIRLSCRCVIDVMLLHCVCCIRLIRSRITVCSVNFHLLLSKFEFEVSLEFEASKCGTSQFARCFLPSLTGVLNDLPYSVFDGFCFKGAVNRWLLP